MTTLKDKSLKLISVPTGLDLDWTGTELGNKQVYAREKLFLANPHKQVFDVI